MEPLDILVRLAHDGDALAIVGITRASITELCFADHRGDTDVLGAWPANRQDRNVDRVPVAVGCLRIDGQIQLDSGALDARFQRAGDAMLVFVEALASELG